MAATPKTFDEHLESLAELVRLKLAFAVMWLKAHPAETFSYVLRNRIDIYRKTDLFSGGPLMPATERFADPRWLALEERLNQACSAHRHDPTTAAFEADGFACLRETVTAGAKVSFARECSGEFMSDFQCGSLRFDAPTAEQPRTCFIHIGNALRPGSIFDDPAYLPGLLEIVMTRASAEFGAERLATSTWLNSLPRWLALFPTEWQANLTPPEGDPDVRGNLGFWGQFITARGTFNAKYGTQLRTTGRMPFLPRTSSCSIAQLRQHLAGGR